MAKFKFFTKWVKFHGAHCNVSILECKVKDAVTLMWLTITSGTMAGTAIRWSIGSLPASLNKTTLFRIKLNGFYPKLY